jgi:hypothetical protein
LPKSRFHVSEQSRLVQVSSSWGYDPRQDLAWSIPRAIRGAVELFHSERRLKLQRAELRKPGISFSTMDGARARKKSVLSHSPVSLLATEIADRFLPGDIFSVSFPTHFEILWGYR